MIYPQGKVLKYVQCIFPVLWPNRVILYQGSPNFFVLGPHKLMKNMSKAGRFTQA